MASEDTREKLLNAAEQLFARNGISATTLRALTRKAAVNLAAVHYHFGSKEALLDAVVERRAAPMNAARLRALDELERLAGSGEPRAEDILRAFFLAGLRSLEKERPETIDLLTRLSARISAEPPEAIEALVRKHFGAVMRRFLEALQRALPELPASVTADRFRFLLGTFNHVFSGKFDLDVIPGHPVRRASDEARVQHLIVFLAAGLSAPDVSRCERASGSATARSNVAIQEEAQP